MAHRPPGPAGRRGGWRRSGSSHTVQTPGPASSTGRGVLATQARIHDAATWGRSRNDSRQHGRTAGTGRRSGEGSGVDVLPLPGREGPVPRILDPEGAAIVRPCSTRGEPHPVDGNATSEPSDATATRSSKPCAGCYWPPRICPPVVGSDRSCWSPITWDNLRNNTVPRRSLMAAVSPPAMPAAPRVRRTSSRSSSASQRTVRRGTR